jgi:phage-related minor tail protein
MASDTSLVFNILAKDKASKTFDKLKGAAAGAGLAIGAALAAGVASTLESSKANGVLAAQLGATPEMAAAFGKISGDVYAKGFGENVTEVNDALKTVWQNGLVPEDAADADIQRVTEKVMTLGTVMGEESERVSAAVSNMLRTGMASSAEEAFDILTRATQQGINKNEDLLDTMNEYSTQFRKLGLDGPAALGLINQAMKAGARDSDTAADALKEFSIRAVDGSKASSTAYQALGLDAKQMTAQMAQGGPAAEKGLTTVISKLKEMKDPVAQSAAAVGLFGPKAEDLGAALYAMDPATAAAGLGKLGGAADDAGKKLQESAGAKLEIFKRQVQAALVEKLAAAVPYIEKTFGWLSKNSSWVVPLATGLGILAGVVYTIVTITKVWTAVQTAFNLVMALNPVTWIVLGILLLIAVIVLVATKTKFFQTIWAAVWGFLKMIGAWFAGPFKDFFVNTWHTITNAASTAWNWIKAKALAFWNWIKAVPGWIKTGWSIMWTNFKTSAGNAWTWIKSKAVGFYNWIVGIPKRVSSKLSSMWDGLKSGFTSVVNWLIGKWNNLSFTIGGGSFMGKQIPSVSFGTPDIPYLAKGGNVQRGGTAVVGDKGPELLSLNRGARVTPLNRAAGATGGGRVVIDVTGADAEMKRLIRKLVRAEAL